MDKREIIDTITDMSDKQKAKIMAIILEEYDNADNPNDLGNRIIQSLESAVRWLS